jgi:DNA-binding beta-propeller fold protein YncE
MKLKWALGSPSTTIRFVLILLCGLLAVAGPPPLSSKSSDAAHLSPGIVATIPVATTEEVSGIGVDAAAGRVFIGRQPSGPPLCLSVIDARTNTITSDVELPFSEYLQTIEVNETTHRVYAVDSFTNTVFIVDGNTNTLITSHQGPGFGQGVAVDPVRNVVYWTEAGGLTVIDGTTNAVTGHIPLGPPEVRDVAINATTNQLYVTDEVGGELIIVDGSSRQVLDRVRVGKPREVAVTTLRTGSTLQTPRQAQFP